MSSAMPVLISMPHSHYVEKARWALDCLGVAYREEPHIPIWHRFATRAHGGSSVPVLVLPSEALTDSTAILRHADAVDGKARLFPEARETRERVQALVDEFDHRLGPHTRRWAYAQLLAEPRALHRMMTRNVPPREQRIFPWVRFVTLHLIRVGLGVTEDGARRSLEAVYSVFDEVGSRLCDGRAYLVGDRLTAADITFAALASPMLLPPECPAGYPTLEEVPSATKSHIAALRDTPAGRYALRIYADHRRTRLGDPVSRSASL